MHYDLHGIPRGKEPVLIDLRYFGVLFDGKDLQPADNPHSVPGYFAWELIASNRAFLHVPAEEPESSEDPDAQDNDPDAQNQDTGAQNRDPRARNRDPKPRGQR